MGVTSSIVTDNRVVEQDSTSRRFATFVATRDTAILDSLVTEHLDRAYSQARNMLFERAEAEDAVQEAFLQLVRSASQYDPSIPFGAWLGRLVRNACINAMRSRSRRKRREAIAEASRKQMRATPVPDGVPSETIRAAVQELPETYRATIDLHYFAGLSQRDTATALGLKENTVAKRLDRARDCLRKLLLQRGVAVSSAAIALALTEIPTHEAPPGLLGTVSAVTTSSTVSGSFVVTAAATATTFTAAKITAAAFFVGALALSTQIDFSTPLSSDPASNLFARAWDFDEGNADGIELLRGSWTAAPEVGVDGSTCMQIDIAETDVEIELPAHAMPYVVSWDSQCIGPERPKGFSISAMPARYEHATLLENIGPNRPLPLSSSWDHYHCYVDHDRVDSWRGDTRTNFLWLDHGNGELILKFRGPFRFDRLAIKSIARSQLPSDGATLVAAAASIPPASRGSKVELPNLPSRRPPDPVVARSFDLPVAAWDFSAPSDEISVLTGSWTPVPTGGRSGSTCMLTSENGFSCQFPDRIEDSLPLLFSGWTRAAGAGTAAMPTVMWNHYSERADCMLDASAKQSDDWTRFALYVTDKMIVSRSGDDLVAFSHVQPVPGAKLILTCASPMLIDGLDLTMVQRDESRRVRTLMDMIAKTVPAARHGVLDHPLGRVIFVGDNPP
jgi:RNA polymerase sigma factor (sigma-70 family)